MNPKTQWTKIDGIEYKLTHNFIELIRIDFTRMEGWRVTLFGKQSYYIKEPFENHKRIQILAEKELKRYIAEVNKILIDV